MLKRSVIFVMALAAAVGAARAQTVDELIGKYMEARGGKAQIKALQSARLTGKMTMAPGVEAPLTLTWKRPMMMRMEFSFQGQTAVQAYDGTMGWSVMPFAGKPDPEKMTEDGVADFADQADFDGELVDWKEKGHTVELLGQEAVDGKQAWKLKITRKNGHVNTIYLAADTYLPLQEASSREMNGQAMDIVTAISDYRKEGDLMMPHTMASTIKAMSLTQTITVEKYELGLAVADSEFKMPEAKPAAPAAPAAGVKPPTQR